MNVTIVKSIKYNGKYLTIGETVDIDDEAEAKRFIALGCASDPAAASESAAESTEVESQDQGPTNDDDDSEEMVTLEQVTEELSKIKGINEELAEALFDIDILSIQEVANAAKDVLVAIPGIGKNSAGKIIKSAKALLR